MKSASYIGSGLEFEWLAQAPDLETAMGSEAMELGSDQLNPILIGVSLVCTVGIWFCTC